MMTRTLLFVALITLTENHAPVVKISLAKDASHRYEISVTDAEDGSSQYDEINPKEVILELRPGTPPGSSPLEAPGLAVMARSNCFNCHQFSGKLIGPSLFDIAKHYPITQAITDTLCNRIRNGSAGIWGKEKMPSHPELSPDDIRSMVQWIEKYAAAPGITYMNGLSGVLPQQPAGTYTLTASYTDHGPKEGPSQHLTGIDHLTLTFH